MIWARNPGYGRWFQLETSRDAEIRAHLETHGGCVCDLFSGDQRLTVELSLVEPPGEEKLDAGCVV